MSIKNAKYLILLSLFFFMFGCSKSQPSKSQPSKSEQIKQIKQTKTKQSENYILNDLNSDLNNECINDLSILRVNNYQDYSKQLELYNNITDQYVFFMVNNKLMDKDTKIFLINQIKVKKDTLCSKIKYNVFLSIKKQLSSLNEI